MLRIRLSKIGRKNRPSYRIVVAEKRSHQSGKVVDIIGYFDPYNPKKTTLDNDKFKYWQEKGAEVADSASKIASSTYQFSKYKPKNERPA